MPTYKLGPASGVWKLPEALIRRPLICESCAEAVAASRLNAAAMTSKKRSTTLAQGTDLGGERYRAPCRA